MKLSTPLLTLLLLTIPTFTTAKDRSRNKSCRKCESTGDEIDWCGLSAGGHQYVAHCYLGCVKTKEWCVGHHREGMSTCRTDIRHGAHCTTKQDVLDDVLDHVGVPKGSIDERDGDGDGFDGGGGNKTVGKKERHVALTFLRVRG